MIKELLHVMFYSGKQVSLFVTLPEARMEDKTSSFTCISAPKTGTGKYQTCGKDW